MSSSSVSTSSSVPEVYKSRKIMTAVSHILMEIVNENKNQNNNKDLVEKQKKLSFFSKSPASVTVSGYIERILKYTHVEESTLIIALIFIDRICELNELVLNETNIHRYF
jgi:hypothetical protein